MADLVGKSLSHYRVVAKLGSGGMAEVYKAYQPGLDRYVGIKVLHSHLVEDKDFIARFEREALTIGKLRHPNIVQAVDFNLEGDMYFMVMEFIDGPTLKDELKARLAANQPFTLEEIARIFLALGSALDYAHARNMVHRDIKPANIMISQEGQVVLTDFGIARLIGATQYTQTGALTGTPAYLSPEQGQGERGDKRSDVYSLGIVLYEIVTGAIPYDADTPFGVIMKHIAEPLPLPTRVKPDLPQAVEAVILKALSKDPDDRYQSAGALGHALAQAVGLSPGDNLDLHPLQAVAPPPKIQQIEHKTGPLSKQIEAAAAALAAPAVGRETLTLPQDDAGPAAPPLTVKKAFPVMPVAIVVGAVALLVAAGLFFTASQPAATPTADAAAIAASTSTAAANLDATATTAAQTTAAAVTAQAAAPTQTAQALLDQASTATAEFQQQSGIVASLLGTAQAGTAAAVTAEAATAAAIANATATAVANFTPTPTATPTSTDTPLPPPPPPPPNAGGGRGGGVFRLVFTKWDGGKHNLYVADTMGANEQYLLSYAAGPSWGPGGQVIYFFGEDGINVQDVNGVKYPFSDISSGIVTLNAVPLPTGMDQIKLSQRNEWKQGSARWASISPDGQLIAYDARPGGDYRIYFFPTDPYQRSNIEIPGEQAEWSPDSQKLVYRSGRNGKTGIWISNRDDSGATNLTNNGGDAFPAWSPDGQTIAFSRDEGGNIDIYTIKIDGSDLQRLTDTPGPDTLPAFTPSGDILFRSARSGGNWGIWKMNSRGDDQVEIIPAAGVGPDWSKSRMDVIK